MDKELRRDLLNATHDYQIFGEISKKEFQRIENLYKRASKYSAVSPCGEFLEAP